MIHGGRGALRITVSCATAVAGAAVDVPGAIALGVAVSVVAVAVAVADADDVAVAFAFAVADVVVREGARVFPGGQGGHVIRPSHETATAIILRGEQTVGQVHREITHQEIIH